MIKESNTPKEWIEKTLGQVVERITKGTTPKTFSVNENDVNYIKSDALNYGGFLDKNKFVKITQEVNDELKRSQLNVDDVLLSMAGEYLGKTGLVKEEHLPANTNQAVAIITVDKNIIYPIFLWYKLRDTNTVKYFKSIPSQSAQPNINFQEIKTLSIKIPPLPEQESIATILTSFDDKIELLQKQNKTLEELAQTLFKEWFGKYKVGDKLPYGWGVGKLSEFGKIICGKTPSKSNEDYFGNDIPFIKIPDMHNKVFILETTDNLSIEGAKSQNNKMLPKNSICISCIATVGLVSITTKKSQTNQQINSIIPNENYFREFLYFTLTKMKNYLNDLGSGGTATLNVNTSTFSNIELVKPKEDIIKDFHKLSNPIFEKVLQNNTQIQTLTKTRDALLPKLMSGEIRVKKQFFENFEELK